MASTTASGVFAVDRTTNIASGPAPRVVAGDRSPAIAEQARNATTLLAVFIA
jgi:hypothetical protein